MVRFFCLFACIACAATWPALMAQTTPATAESHAVLYIYRKGAFRNGYYDIWINGKAIVKDFRPRTYFAVKTLPGTLYIRTTGRPIHFVEEKTFRMEVLAGREYYLEAVLDYDFLSGSLYLVQRHADDFQQRLKGLKLDEKAKTKLE